MIALDELNIRMAEWLPSARLACELSPTLLIGEISTWRIGRCSLARLRSNSSRLASPGGGGLLLIVLLQGTLAVATHGLKLAPGASALASIDLASAWQIDFQGLCDVLLLHAPEFPVTCNSRATTIPASSVAGSMLRQFLLTAVADAELASCTAAQGQAIEACIRHLLQGAMCHLTADTPVTESLASRQQIDETIREHLRNPKLGPSFLAQVIGLSRRQLYRLFEGEEDGISQHIRRLRLEMIAQDLQDALFDDMNVSLIAERWGMPDSANFSRLFKKHFGITPSDMRRIAQAQAAATSR